MPCPDLGALRASLDGDAATGAAPARDHLLSCAACRDAVAELRRNAELAAPAIAMTGLEGPLPAAAVEAALARLEQRRARLLAARTASPPADRQPPEHVQVTPLRRRGGRLAQLGTRSRVAAAALVAAVALAGVVATPSGRAAASSFLAQFRSERIEVLSLDRNQAMQLTNVMSQLVDTGVFTADYERLFTVSQPSAARDLAEASRLAGFQVRGVAREALPSGVGATPERILVTRPDTVRITLDRDQAIAYFQRHGRADVRIPERFDGAQLVVRVPAIVVQQFPGRDGVPRLLVGQAGMLGLDADGGASLDELRDLMLSLPGLPPETVEQLRGIDDWRTTLPLPVPVDEVHWKPASVDGAEANAFTDPTGKLNALLWQRGGHIWGVAGMLGADEALDVADSLG